MDWREQLERNRARRERFEREFHRDRRAMHFADFVFVAVVVFVVATLAWATATVTSFGG